MIINVNGYKFKCRKSSSGFIVKRKDLIIAISNGLDGIDFEINGCYAYLKGKNVIIESGD